MLLFQNENQAWLIIPTSVAASPVSRQPFISDSPISVQLYAMNTISGAWAQYTNMDMRCACLWVDNPIFITGDGRVCRAWVGYFDNVPWNGTVGDRIECEVLTAYNYFQALGQTKRWTLVRPIFQSGSLPASAYRLEVDFAVTGELAIIPTGPPSSDFVWDGTDSRWDSARWNSEYQRYRRWTSVQGMGYAAALHILVAQNVQTLWVAVDYVYELGATV
jgi:hypothetical protein